jgi:hypothetical protein
MHVRRVIVSMSYIDDGFPQKPKNVASNKTDVNVVVIVDVLYFLFFLTWSLLTSELSA